MKSLPRLVLWASGVVFAGAGCLVGYYIGHLFGRDVGIIVGIAILFLASVIVYCEGT